jgi:NAD(P)-dependent dehydrogenase (short-subunit alcohol dehydrogenase family)
MTEIEIDFSEPRATERQIEAHRAALERSDALVHLAAMYAPTPYGAIRADDVMRAVATNAVPGVLLTQMIGPAMAGRGFGRIVQVSSIGVKFAGGSNSYCYALSKHALELIPAAHKTWAASNVLVNALRIGVTDTRFHGLDASKDMGPRVAMIPARRMATPAEIAEVLFWYGSEKNSFVTGEVVAIAGGE